jgi:hypothetical protein
MVCQIFYYAVQNGTNCIGESCEVCKPLFNNIFSFLLFLIIAVIALTVWISLIPYVFPVAVERMEEIVSSGKAL